MLPRFSSLILNQASISSRKCFSTTGAPTQTKPFIYYVNGQFSEADKSSVNVRDLAILRVYGCFDYLRTYNGKPFHLLRNVQRLRNSCKIIELDFPWTDQELSDIILQTLDRNRDNGFPEKGIRVVVSGGVSSNNIIPDGKPTLAVMIEAPSNAPENLYFDGAKVVTIVMGRLFPTAKTINYIPAIIAQKKSKKAGGIEAIYVNEGYVQEGTTSNIFAFFGDKLVTPSGEILLGLTRAAVIEVAKGKFEVEICPLRYEQLLKADEVFITSANRRVLPVVDVDGKSIGNGKPGKNTKVLMKMFDEVCYKI